MNGLLRTEQSRRRAGPGPGFGFPMAFVFERFDWDRSVGAHDMTSTVSWLMTPVARCRPRRDVRRRLSCRDLQRIQERPDGPLPFVSSSQWR